MFSIWRYSDENCDEIYDENCFACKTNKDSFKFGFHAVGFADFWQETFRQASQIAFYV